MVDLSVVKITVELDINVEVAVDFGDVIDVTVEDVDVSICVKVGDIVTVEVTENVEVAMYMLKSLIL